MTRFRPVRITASALTLLLAAHVVSAQTVITPPKNKYTPAQDVELGRQAAQEVEQQLPLLRDEDIQDYVEDVGERLERAIPENLRHPEFDYTFEVMNLREINAFALPGGPTYYHRGMLQAAKTEGEIAGVMAHELSHVVLRHGTAQATKATPYQIGAVAGQILGAIIGGTTGNVVAQGTQFGLGAAFLRYSREYEKQADILGAQIMARAGYDPRDMASMFDTIEKQGSARGPEWLSNHPNPGNRSDYIIKEAQSLRVENPVRDTRGFQEVQAELRSMPPAPTTEQVAKNGAKSETPVGTSGRVAPGRVEPPSRSMRTYDGAGVFRVSVPSNWRELGGEGSITFAPEGGYGNANGQSVFTHGMQFGMAETGARNLQAATDELLDALARSNPSLRRTGGYTRGTIDGREGLRAVLTNQSEATGQEERIALYATQLEDGNLFYALGVAPRDVFSTYQAAFQRAIQSLQLAR
jgi:Zn-dependent protease with chaperone function